MDTPTEGLKGSTAKNVLPAELLVSVEELQEARDRNTSGRSDGVPEPYSDVDPWVGQDQKSG
jgi:hypothetical protein